MVKHKMNPDMMNKVNDEEQTDRRDSEQHMQSLIGTRSKESSLSSSDYGDSEASGTVEDNEVLVVWKEFLCLKEFVTQEINDRKESTLIVMEQVEKIQQNFSTKIELIKMKENEIEELIQKEVEKRTSIIQQNMEDKFLELEMRINQKLSAQQSAHFSSLAVARFEQAQMQSEHQMGQVRCQAFNDSVVSQLHTLNEYMKQHQASENTGIFAVNDEVQVSTDSVVVVEADSTSGNDLIVGANEEVETEPDSAGDHNLNLNIEAKEFTPKKREDSFSRDELKDVLASFDGFSLSPVPAVQYLPAVCVPVPVPMPMPVPVTTVPALPMDQQHLNIDRLFIS